jgi:hypothetical protein
MLVTCKACNVCKEMRVGKKQSQYFLMLKDLRSSFGATPDLCHECLSDILKWIHSRRVKLRAAG